MRRLPCCNMVIASKAARIHLGQKKNYFSTNAEICRGAVFLFPHIFPIQSWADWSWVIDNFTLEKIHSTPKKTPYALECILCIFTKYQSPQYVFYPTKSGKLMVWWLFSISQSFNFDKKCESQKYKLSKFLQADQSHNFKPFLFLPSTLKSLNTKMF